MARTVVNAVYQRDKARLMNEIESARNGMADLPAELAKIEQDLKRVIAGMDSGKDKMLFATALLAAESAYAAKSSLDRASSSAAGIDVTMTVDDDRRR